MSNRATAAALVVLMPLLSGCPLLTPPSEDDAGLPGDAGSDGPNASDATGSFSIVVRDGPGGAVKCEVDIPLPEVRGFGAFTAVFANDAESAFAFGVAPHSGGLGAEDPPLGAIVLSSRFSGKPEEPRADTANIALADLTELSVTTQCDQGDGELFSIGGTATSVASFAVAMSAFTGPARTAQPELVCDELPMTFPCSATEGRVTSVGALTFTSGDGDDVEVSWDLEQRTDWVYGDG